MRARCCEAARPQQPLGRARRPDARCPSSPRRALAVAAAAAASSAAAPAFLTPLGPPLCELPHAHATHVAVAVRPVAVRLSPARSLALVAPDDPGAVETMHALLGEDVRRALQAAWVEADAAARRATRRRWRRLCA